MVAMPTRLASADALPPHPMGGFSWAAALGAAAAATTAAPAAIFRKSRRDASALGAMGSSASGESESAD
jgi:hypothetical protein